MGTRPRTKNFAENKVIDHLEAEGYEVFKRGWPDFIAVRGDEVRFIEVKPHQSYGLSWSQSRMARILGSLGLKVELLSPEVLPQQPSTAVQ